MKTHKLSHCVCVFIVIVLVLMGVHYFTHHKGANPISSYIPGA